MSTNSPGLPSLFFSAVIHSLDNPRDNCLSDPPDSLLDPRTKSLPFHHHHTTSGDFPHPFEDVKSRLHSPSFTADCRPSLCPKARSSPSASLYPCDSEKDRYFPRRTAATNTTSGSALAKSYQIGIVILSDLLIIPLM